MNRRKFLGSLVTIPFIGKFCFSVRSSENPIKSRDIFEIFSPDEIRRTWGKDSYVETPVFERNGKLYYMGVKRLNMTVFEHQLIPENRKIFQSFAKYKINQHRPDYIHSVRFFESPIIHPETFQKYYCGYIRVAHIKL